MKKEKRRQEINKRKNISEMKCLFIFQTRSFQASNLTVRVTCCSVTFATHGQVTDLIRSYRIVAGQESGTEDKNLPQNKRKSGSRSAALYALDVVFFNSMTSLRVAVLKASGEKQ